jgi:ATP-dependent Clp protease protease subunit
MANKTKFWNFKAKTKTEGELLLYGDLSSVSWYEDSITPKEFKKDLDALGDIDILNIYVNSPGGDVFAAQAMVSMLKRHKAEKNIYVDGLMASAATFFVDVGKVFMPSNAMMMIHNPMGLFVGNANDARKFADDLDKVRESMLAIYREKTGMKDNEIIPLLDAETWMTAEEAINYGFADEVEAEKKVAASLNGEELIFNGISAKLERFKHPEAIARKFEGNNSSCKSSGIDLYQKIIKNNERRAKILLEPKNNTRPIKEIPLHSVDSDLVDRVVGCISFCKKDLNLPDDVHVRYYDSQSADSNGFVYFNTMKNEIWLNCCISRLNEEAQSFVVRHECKHLQQKLQGKPANEEEADSYAYADIHAINNNYSIKEFCMIHSI